MVTQITVDFSGAINANEADEVTAYRLKASGKKGSFTAKNAAAIKLRSAAFNAALDEVTLTPKKAFALTKRVQLMVDGQSLEDSEGRPIDGGDDGQPGSSFVTVLTRPATASFSPAHANAPAPAPVSPIVTHTPRATPTPTPTACSHAHPDALPRVLRVGYSSPDVIETHDGAVVGLDVDGALPEDRPWALRSQEWDCTASSHDRQSPFRPSRANFAPHQPRRPAHQSHPNRPKVERIEVVVDGGDGHFFAGALHDDLEGRAQSRVKESSPTN